MTHFDHLLHKIDDSCNAFITGLQQQYEVCTNNIEQFEKYLTEKYGINTTLQSICEDEDEGTSRLSSESTSTDQSQEKENILSNQEKNKKKISTENHNKNHVTFETPRKSQQRVETPTEKHENPSNDEKPSSNVTEKPSESEVIERRSKRLSDKENELNAMPGSPTRSKKRSKADMQEAPSPEGGKRLKRHASAKALLSINEQTQAAVYVEVPNFVNVNLTQKLRRPEAEEDKNVRKGRKAKESQEKSSQEAFLLKVKTEKLSVAENRAEADEEMSVDTSIQIKTEAEILMPPPPIPRPRRNAASASNSSETQEFRRSTRGRKKNLEAEVTRESRATRSSARSGNEDMPPPEAYAKPKRSVRGRKGQSRQKSVEEIDQKPVIDPEKNDISTETKETEKQESEVLPRTKRTRARKGQKQTESSEEAEQRIEVDHSTDSEKEEVQIEQKEPDELEIEVMPPPAMLPPASRPKRTRGMKGQKQTESSDGAEQRMEVDHSMDSEKEEVRTEQKEPDKLETEVMPPPSILPPTSRPKRTKGIKRHENVDQVSTDNVEPSASQSQETADPQEKSRSKRTRKGKKATTEEPVEPQTEDLKSTSTEISSPILQSQPVKRLKKLPSGEEQREDNVTRKDSSSGKNDTPFKGFLNQEEDTGTKRGIQQSAMDAESKHGNVTEETAENARHNMNGTVVLERNLNIINQKDVSKNQFPVLNETMVLHKNTLTPPVQNNSKPMMNETVVLNKATSTPNNNKKIMNETVTLNMNGYSTIMTNDESMMTDDNSGTQNTPTQAPVQRNISPPSIVKQKVQQFEDLAAGRATRTKTRALTKQLEQINKLPSAHLLSASTLARLADVQQNGILHKPNPYQSNSSTKPRANIITTVKSFLPNSASKTLNQINATQRTGEVKGKTTEKEDAQRKKEAAARKREAMQARIEEQKRKREEKMAAAAAVREALDRERERTLAQNARSRQERAALNQDMKEQEKQKELERKKQLQEKKAAEIEERRRADEAARLAKLEEEQRKAEAARRKQMEQERIRKEALTVEKEMHATTQQYLAKEKEREKIKLQQMKHRMEADRLHTSMTAPGTPAAKMAPVHMADGFEYMNSDSEDDDKQPKRPTPAWSTRPERHHMGVIQRYVNVLHVDRLFSVQKHSPDLTEMFPSIDKRALKRTSSAVWLTPPRQHGYSPSTTDRHNPKYNM